MKAGELAHEGSNPSPTVKCPLCYGEGCEYCDDGQIDPSETVWGYLQDAPLNNHYFSRGRFFGYYGIFLEKLGRRVINEKLDLEWYAPLFPDTEIISSDSIGSWNERKKLKHGTHYHPDLIKVLHCKRGDDFEKNAVVFEIKSGVSPINKHHLDRWEDLINHPDKYIKKCRQIRVFLFWIKGMDIEARNIFYTLKEFVPEEVPNNFESY